MSKLSLFLVTGLVAALSSCNTRTFLQTQDRSQPGAPSITKVIQLDGKPVVSHNGKIILFAGIQYWGLDSWENRTWDSDIANFKKLGLNGVRLNIAWDHIEVADNQFDFSQLDELLTKFNDAGLYVYLQLNQSAHSWKPHWFEKEIAEKKLPIYAIDSFGNRTGRYSFASEDFRKFYSRYVLDTIAHVKMFPNIVAYSVYTEPHYEPDFEKWLDYNPANILKFQEWIADRYGKVAALNKAWNTSCHSLNEAEPFPGLPPKNWQDLPKQSQQRFLDWRMWNATLKAQFIGRLVAEGRKRDPNHLFGQNMMWKWTNGWQSIVSLDPEINYAYADIIGLNVYPDKSKPEKISQYVNFIMSLYNRKKAVWLGEFNAKEGASAKDLQAMTAPAFAAGLSGFTYFLYRAFQARGEDHGGPAVVCESDFVSKKCNPESFVHLANFMHSNIVGQEETLLKTPLPKPTKYYLWPQETQYLAYLDGSYSVEKYATYLAKEGPGLQALSEERFVARDFTHDLPIFVPDTPFRSQKTATAITQWIKEDHQVILEGTQDKL